MKNTYKTLALAVAFLLCLTGFAQPQFFKYQTVVRDGAGDLIQNKPVGFKMSIRSNFPFGTIVYQETHSVTTNEFGLAIFNIGQGFPIIGTFNSVNWKESVFYLETELDINDGSGFVVMGVSQMASVPFALHSETSADSFWEKTGNDIFYNNGKVGVGLASPTGDFHVAKNIANVEAVFGDDIDTYPEGTSVNIGDNNEESVLYVGQSLYNKGYISWHYNETPEDAIYSIGAYAGFNDLVLQRAGGNVGIGYLMTNPTELLHIDGNMRLQGAIYDSNNEPGISGQILQSTGAATDWVDATSISDGDWTVSGNNMYSVPSGDVSIGTIATDKKFTVKEDFSSTNTVEDVLSIWRGSTGTVATGIGAGLIFRNEVDNGAFALSGRISSVMENVDASGSAAGMLFETRNSAFGNVDALYLDPNGRVGIGNTNPTATLDVDGSIKHDYVGTSHALEASGSTSSVLYYIHNDINTDGWGLSAGLSSSTTGNTSYGIYGFNHGTGYAIYGNSWNSAGTGVYGINISTNNYGYAGGAYYGIYGFNNAGNYGFIGGSAFGVYGKLVTTDAGDYAIYGYGTDANTEIGTGYGYTQTLGSVKGYNSYGMEYTFAMAGYSYLDDDRSGGTFGARSWTSSAVWGCLAYQRTGGTEYGGYFTTYTSGTGKDSNVKINNGIGAWGDLFGADIHGKVYGTYTEGKNYAMYSNGTVFKNDLDVHLQKYENKNTVLYTNVSTDVTVQTSGYATLSNGESNIAFDESFASVVSTETPIVVTVTPVGNSNGVYLAEVNPSGFKVVENNDGKSNVTVTYIAIGKRAGYENPQLPEEVVDIEYTSNLARGLHNDGDTETDGEGLYYENGKLIVGVHSSTLPDPNRPIPVLEEAESPAKHLETAREGLSPDGRAIVQKEQESKDFQIRTPKESQPLVEQEIIPTETLPETLTPKANEVKPQETKEVKSKPNYKTSDGGPERK